MSARRREATTRSAGLPRPAAAALVLVGFLLAACNVSKPQVDFDEEQRAAAARQIEKGSGRVQGSAFVHAPSGRTYTAGGDWVYLIPATAYAQERMRIIYGTARQRRVTLFSSSAGELDPAYAALTRKEKADMHGRFDFAEVKPGRWFAVARVRWEARDEAHVVDVYDEVEVKPGETTKVVLSGR